MAKIVCMARKTEQVKRRGKASVEWCNEDGTPHYYCYGYIDFSTEELLDVCKMCRGNVDFAQEDFENWQKAENQGLAEAVEQ